MTHTTITTVNAVLDLLVVLAVFAIVWLTHRLQPSQPIQLRLASPADRAEDLSRAA
jgi:hypothetical protein